jgi:hypothetical protein
VGSAAIHEVKIGVLEGSVYQTILERDFPDVEIKLYSSLAAPMHAVRNDEIFGGAHGGLHIAFFMRQHPSTAIYSRLL